VVTPLRLTLPLILACFALGARPAEALAAPERVDVPRLAALLDPAKLATLGPRGANPRVQKAVAWLAVAQADGRNLDTLLEQALAGKMKPEAARLTKEALLRNLDIAGKLGCLDPEGLAEMRRGKAATVKRGPYAGDQSSVDHIVPLAVAPELGNTIANLELMPMRLNASKRDRVGERQLSHARALRKVGLLSAGGLRSVEAAAR
jgi:hypothetical protein